ncbi:RNA polymerase II subunit A C-terminal domain phosphatase isoform X2 [Hydra vulgaris]|uniref:RNA polymerase II subunit A C-terminal domain phosphatase n=1 Tax=Hydra vulgaris TaxID=6087 RepID=A0ABM4DPA4_HYDVU
MATRDLVLSCISKSKILKWHVKPNDSVKKDNIIATYVFTEKIPDSSSFIVQRKLKAKFNGKVVDLSVKPNEDVSRGQVVARLIQQDCEHNTLMKDMCCDCGADLRKEAGIPGNLVEATTASVPVVHNILELKVSVEEAEKLAKYDEQQLLRARKLVLVVDLDMTLIHTTVEPTPKNTKDVFSFKLPGHQYEYHTKLRPGARKFLESISKFYELHIFTMGSRLYAHTVAKCLDPDGKFFAHRIRSRDEFINSFSKFHDLKALFPCGDHMVCIIDDREDVWNYAPNLITVKPYKFFKGGDDINDPFQTPGLSVNSEVCEKKVADDNQVKDSCDEKIKTANTTADEDPAVCSVSSEKNDSNKKISLIESSSNENTLDKANGVENRTDNDDYLFYLDEILERVHYSFYSTLDAVKAKGGAASKDTEITKFCTFGTMNPDIRVILPELRRQTLKGCNIVFTGVIPTNCPLEKSKAWKTAVSLGARVTSEVVGKEEDGLRTTHVVAARHGTHKAHKAYKSPDINLVNPNWLWCSSERWEWAEESIFPVPIVENGTPGSSRQVTPQHNSFESFGKAHNKKKLSPLAEEGFEIPKDNTNLVNSNHPLSSLSKTDIDEMDKEVNELMSIDDDSNSSCAENKFACLSDPGKRKRPVNDDLNLTYLSKKLLKSVGDNDGEDEDITDHSSSNEDDYSSSSSSSSSDSDSSSENGDQLRTLLDADMVEC